MEPRHCSSAFLFLIGINDLPVFMKNEFFKLFADQSALLTLYADDINQIVHRKDQDMLTQLCSATLNIIQQYTGMSRLVLNYSKTNMMNFHAPTATPVPTPALVIGGIPISEPPCVPFIGLRLTPTLKWDEQVSYMLVVN